MIYDSASSTYILVISELPGNKRRYNHGFAHLGLIIPFGAYVQLVHAYIIMYTCVTSRGWIKSAATHFISYEVRASRTFYTNCKLLQKNMQMAFRGDTNYINHVYDIKHNARGRVA